MGDAHTIPSATFTLYLERGLHNFLREWQPNDDVRNNFVKKCIAELGSVIEMKDIQEKIVQGNNHDRAFTHWSITVHKSSEAVVRTGKRRKAANTRDPKLIALPGQLGQPVDKQLLLLRTTEDGANR
jgi:hypothetical protein